MAMLCVKIPANVAHILSQHQVPGKREPKEGLHITLIHFGDALALTEVTKITESLFPVLSDLKPIPIYTDTIDAFPGGEDGYPLICPIVSSELHEAQSQVRRALDCSAIEYSKKFPDFKPHLTLSYSPDLIPKQSIPPTSFIASDIYLVGGSRDKDTVDVRFPLQGMKRASLRVAARHLRESC